MTGRGGTERDAPVLRVHHYDLIVHDLHETTEFYRRLTMLRAGSPRRNRGVSLGEGRRGVVDSLMLTNREPGFEYPALHLMRWITPSATGRAHEVESSTGFYRLVLHTPDLARTRAAVIGLGITPFAPTTGDDFRFEIGSRGAVAFHAFACTDPNGVVVEFVEGPIPRVSVAAQGTADAAASAAALSAGLGLQRYDTVRTIDPTPNIYSRRGGEVAFHGEFLRAPGTAPGYVDLLQFHHPAPRPAYPALAHIGIVRATFEVADLDAAWARLAAVPTLLREDPPTRFDFGDPIGTARIAGFRDAEGVRYQLLERLRGS